MEFNKHTLIALALGLVIGFSLGRAVPTQQAHHFESYGGHYLLDTSTGRVCDPVEYKPIVGGDTFDQQAAKMEAAEHKYPHCEK